jgi:hypothetical protein
MKTLLTLASFLFIFGTMAQNYDDLKILYADANYEKLVAKAVGYTEKDKTKKDIPPYFWAAKGLYKISISGTTDERYKNAYKDAIKYLGKGIKYDLKYDEGAYMAEEKEFVDMFQMSLVEMIENEISIDNWRGAYSWALKYTKVTQDITGSLYLQGVCKFRSQDKVSARDLWKKGNVELEKIESIEDWSEADRKMLMMGVLYTGQALNDSRQQDKARALLGKAAQWFEDDPLWQEKYDEIVN